MERAVTWYHARLLAAPDAADARRYLRSRGYDSETVKKYRLGWAPDGWDALVANAGVPGELLVAAGLAYRNKADRLNDSFRARVLFPIFDAAGRPVGLGGRVLPGGSGPSTRTRRPRPYTTRAGCCTGSTGPRGPSSNGAGWWCARATPT